MLVFVGFFLVFLTSLASELHLQIVWLCKNMVIYCIYMMCLLFGSNKESSSSSSYSSFYILTVSGKFVSSVTVKYYVDGIVFIAFSANV